MSDILKDKFSQIIAAMKDCSSDVFPVSSEIVHSEAYQKREMSKRFAEAVRTATIGDKMPDATIYVGLYNGYDWFTTATDALDADRKRLEMTYDEAVEYAKNLHAHGHDDWMLPTGKSGCDKSMLDALYFSRDSGSLSGTFSHNTGSGWYWMGINDRAEEYPGAAVQRNFTNGAYDIIARRSDPGIVRCVRKQLRKSPENGT